MHHGPIRQQLLLQQPNPHLERLRRSQLYTTTQIQLKERESVLSSHTTTFGHLNPELQPYLCALLSPTRPLPHSKARFWRQGDYVTGKIIAIQSLDDSKINFSHKKYVIKRFLVDI
jgi:hypothetical protein